MISVTETVTGLGDITRFWNLIGEVLIASGA